MAVNDRDAVRAGKAARAFRAVEGLEKVAGRIVAMQAAGAVAIDQPEIAIAPQRFSFTASQVGT